MVLLPRKTQWVSRGIAMMALSSGLAANPRQGGADSCSTQRTIFTPSRKILKDTLLNKLEARKMHRPLCSIATGLYDPNARRRCHAIPCPSSVTENLFLLAV